MTKSFLKLSKETNCKFKEYCEPYWFVLDQSREHNNPVIEQLLTSILKAFRDKEMHDFERSHNQNFLAYKLKTWRQSNAVFNDNHCQHQILHTMCKFLKKIKVILKNFKLKKT